MKLIKYTGTDVKNGAVALLGSLALEGLLLAPKRSFTVPGIKKEVSVSGLVPLSQTFLAEVARKAANDWAPVLMRQGENLLRKVKLYDALKTKLLDFLYVRFADISMSDLLTYFFNRATFINRSNIASGIRDWIYSVMNSDEDRETFVANLTDNILAGLQALSTGTVGAVLVSVNMLRVVEETIQNIVEKFFSSDIGIEVANRLFDAIEHMEEMTLPFFLDHNLNLPRETMSDKLDAAFDAFLGKDRVQRYVDKNYGDQLYNTFVSMDYDKVWKELKQHHTKELGAIALGSAGTAMYWSRKAGKTARRVRKVKVALAKKED